MRKLSLIAILIVLLNSNVLFCPIIMATAIGESSSLFESGFENDINSDFEGTRVRSSAAVFERDTNIFFNGSHSLHIIAPPRSDSLQYAWTNFDQKSEIYIRFYVYFPEGSLFLYPNAWSPGSMSYWLYFLAGFSYIEPDGTEPRCERSGHTLATCGFLRLMYFPESQSRSEGYYFSGSSWSESEGNRVYRPFDTPTSAAFPIETNKWYCLEVHYRMASGPRQNDGLAELWVNGNFVNGQYTSTPYLLAFNIANYEPDAPYYGAIEIGNRELPPSSTPETTPNLEIYIDSLKISTTPIGPESGANIEIPPEIGTPYQEPQTVMANENVTISVNVTDSSGISEVILRHSSDNGTTWTNTTMTYKSENLYEVIVDGFPMNTNIRYEIIAIDNVGNVAIENNAGQYHIYNVIPEFSAWSMIILTLILVSLVIFWKRKLIH